MRRLVPLTHVTAPTSNSLVGAKDCPTADGFVSVYPCGIAQPSASNLNFATGSDVANTVIVKPGTAGKVCIYNSGLTHLIVDVNGYLPN